MLHQLHNCHKIPAQFLLHLLYKRITADSECSKKLPEEIFAAILQSIIQITENQLNIQNPHPQLPEVNPQLHVRQTILFQGRAATTIAPELKIF
jgi:hypothetical protein